MALSPTLIKRLHEALANAFFDAGELRRFVRFCLGVDLDRLSDGGTDDRIFALLVWAESRGQTEQLLNEAIKERENVEEFKAIRREMKGLGRPTLGRYECAPTDDEDDARFFLANAHSKEKLHGREQELTDLHAWLASGERISVRVLIGEAGLGKTRLALGLCLDVHDKADWNAGFIDHKELEDFPEEQPLRRWRWSRPMLVVVDDAAACAPVLKEWLRELAANREETPPLRLLLLERHASPREGWWRVVIGNNSPEVFAMVRDTLAPHVVELGPIEDVEPREAILKGALSKRSVPLPPLDEHAPAWTRNPLFLMVAARMAAKGASAVLSMHYAQLALHVAKRETERLERIARGHGVSEKLFKHLLAIVTLRQGVPRNEIEQVIEDGRKEMEEQGGRRQDLVEALYKAAPGNDHSVAPVLPDIIGEAFVGSWLNELLPGAARRTVLNAAQGDLSRTAGTVVRGVLDFIPWGEGGRGSKEVEDIHKVLVKCCGQLVDTCVSVEDVERLGSTLFQRSLALREPAFQATARALELMRRDPSTNPRDLAGALNNHAVRLSDLERYHEALAHIRDAARVYEDLVRSAHEDALADLALTQNNIAMMAQHLGLYDEAVEAAERSVATRRTLAARDSDRDSASLACSLNTLADLRVRSGHGPAALVAAREAHALYRSLIPRQLEVHLRNYAATWDTLAQALSLAGDLAEAEQNGRSSLHLHEELVAMAPGEFDIELSYARETLARILLKKNGLREARELIAQALADLSFVHQRYPAPVGERMRGLQAFLKEINDEIGEAKETEPS